jgi:aminopeptidase N
VPALGPEELAPPSAPGTTTFRIPVAWHSVSNGKRLSRTVEGSEAVEVWSSDVAVARSFVAAPFSDIETDGRVSTYLLKRRSSIAAQTEILERAIEVMERRFGPYPYDTFHVVELPEDASFAAASEQGFIMVRGSLLDSPAGNLPLFAHEAAHGWWGNLVRNDGPGGKMMAEALAQYGAVISIEELEGEAAASRFLRYSRENYNPLQCALGFFYIWREGGDRPLAQLESARWDHNLSDSKGMWFYRMLRDEMGDEKFFGVLRGIIRDYSRKQITLDDFRALLGPELKPFLEQWLDRPGAPVLIADWFSSDRGRAVTIRVDQLQGGEPYELPLDVLIKTDSGEEVRTTVKLCSRQDTFFVLTGTRPVAVVLDPDDRVLIWRPEYGARPDP